MGNDGTNTKDFMAGIDLVEIYEREGNPVRVLSEFGVEDNAVHQTQEGTKVFASGTRGPVGMS